MSKESHKKVRVHIKPDFTQILTGARTNYRRRSSAEKVLLYSPDDSLDYPVYEEPEDNSSYDGEERMSSGDIM